MLGDLVAARDAQIDAAFADEGRDVCGGEEDECDGQVLDQGDVEARLAAKLDVAAGEKVQGGLLETALCLWGLIALAVFPEVMLCVVCVCRGETCGFAEVVSHGGRELALRDGEDESSF